MQRRIVQSRESPDTCVWVDAGLLTYKLCERNFDCEHCPLDAALHGISPSIARRTSPVGCAELFPDDRRYCNGHTWLHTLDDAGCVRLGVDHFAASLIPEPVRIRIVGPPRLIHRGQPLCVIDVERASLTIAAPIDARVARWNCALGDHPRLLIDTPYDDGWILELWPLDPAEIHAFRSSHVAETQAGLDFRHLLRRIGQHLLFDHAPDANPALNGRLNTDVRGILGSELFVQLLQEIVR